MRTKTSYLTGPSLRETRTLGAPEPRSQTWKPVVYPMRSTGRRIRPLLFDLLDVYSRWENVTKLTFSLFVLSMARDVKPLATEDPT